jgi:putative transposase
MLKATKVRIYPTPEQVEFLNAQFGAVRFAFNRGLAIQSHFYKVKGVSLKPLSDIKPLLANAKKSRKYSWLKQYDSIALQQGVIQLDKAFKNFFNPKLNAEKNLKRKQRQLSRKKKGSANRAKAKGHRLHKLSHDCYGR